MGCEPADQPLGFGRPTLGAGHGLTSCDELLEGVGAGPADELVERHGLRV